MLKKLFRKIWPAKKQRLLYKTLPEGEDKIGEDANGEDTDTTNRDIEGKEVKAPLDGTEKKEEFTTEVTDTLTESEKNFDGAYHEMNATEFLELPLEERLYAITKRYLTDIRVGTVLTSFFPNPDQEQYVGAGDIMPEGIMAVNDAYGNLKVRDSVGGDFHDANTNEYFLIVDRTEWIIAEVMENPQEIATLKEQQKQEFQERFTTTNFPANEEKISETSQLTNIGTLEKAEKFKVDPYLLVALSTSMSIYDKGTQSLYARYIRNSEKIYERTTASTKETNGIKHYTSEFLIYALNRLEISNKFVGIPEVIAQQIFAKYNERRNLNLVYKAPAYQPSSGGGTQKIQFLPAPLFETIEGDGVPYFATNYFKDANGNFDPVKYAKFKEKQEKYRGKRRRKFETPRYEAFYHDYFTDSNGQPISRDNYPKDYLRQTKRLGKLPVPMNDHQREIVPMMHKECLRYNEEIMHDPNDHEENTLGIIFGSDWKVRYEFMGKRMKTNVVLGCILLEAEYRCKQLGMSDRALTFDESSSSNEGKSKDRGRTTFHGLAMGVDLNPHDNWLGDPASTEWNIPIALVYELQNLGCRWGMYYYDSRSDHQTDAMHWEFRGSIPDAMASLTSPAAKALAEEFIVPRSNNLNLMEYAAYLAG